jgi:hypothetical protein
LWYWNAATTIWNWVAGCSATDKDVSYGTQGIYDTAQFPGARDRVGMVIDSSNRLFINMVIYHLLRGFITLFICE